MPKSEKTSHVVLSDPRNPLGDMEDDAICGLRSAYLNLEAKSLLVAIYILPKSSPGNSLCPMGPPMTAETTLLLHPPYEWRGKNILFLLIFKDSMPICENQDSDETCKASFSSTLFADSHQSELWSRTNHPRLSIKGAFQVTLLRFLI